MIGGKRQADDQGNTPFVGVQAWIAQGLWILLAILCLVYFVIVWVAEFQRPLSDCLLPNADCNPIDLNVNDLAVVQDSGFPVQAASNILRVLNLAANGVFLLTAALIFWRKANDRMALFVSGALMVLGAVCYSPTAPDWLLAMPVLDTLVTILALMGYIAPLLLLFFFPDGRFVPSWSRFIVLGITLFTVMNMFLSLTGGSSGTDLFFFVYFMALAISVLLGIGCAVYRYRRIATLQQQQQLKWVAFGIVCIASTVLLWFIYSFFFPPDQPTPTRTFAVLSSYLLLFPLMSLFPICVMIAILRYRLFDIDILIRRTLQYSILTGLLGLVYFGGVVLFQGIFRTTSSETSSLAIVLSTLIIAALFAPLRQRVQTFIDRRFFRQKYAAAQVLADFARTARDETDIHQLTTRLVEVVQETMQPEQVTLWIKEIPKR